MLAAALIVIFVLVLFLGNWRVRLAWVILLAMLCAVGIICHYRRSHCAPLHGGHVPGHAAGGQLTPNEMNEETYTAASNIRSSAVFGEIITLIVYLPLLALAGIESKMSGPWPKSWPLPLWAPSS